MKQIPDLPITKRAFGLLCLLGLVCVLQPPAQGEQARAQLTSKSLRDYARKSEPVKSKKVLQSRFGISAKRAQTIFVGKKGKAKVGKRLGLIAGDSGVSEYTCTPHGCSCHGDDDCNLMFTQVCADPDTNGSCTGDVCVCTP